MTSTFKTRKPVDQLTADDFRCFPSWEFAIDEESNAEQDETWVRPVNGNTVRRNVYSQLVAANFRTHGGHALFGFMVVSTVDRQVEIAPGAIVDPVGYLPLPSVDRETANKEGFTWVLRERDALVDALNSTDEAIFPLEFALQVPIANEEHLRTGTID